MADDIKESPLELQPEGDAAVRSSLELIYHVSRELSSALDLRTVLQRVVFLSMRTVGASSGSLIVLDDTGKPVESAIIIGEKVHDHTTQRLRATLDYGLAGWVVRNRAAALVPDTGQDERWTSRQYEQEERFGPKSAVAAPLLTRDMLVGVITLVHPRPGFFTPEHLALVQAIADQAGIAVLNARLYAESQRRLAGPAGSQGQFARLPGCYWLGRAAGVEHSLEGWGGRGRLDSQRRQGGGDPRREPRRALRPRD